MTEVCTAFTTAFLSGPVPPEMLNTRGLPEASTAPVRSARADIETLGEKLGPRGLRIAVPLGVRPITEIPIPFNAAIASGSVTAPSGATALGTVLPVFESALPTNPKRFAPRTFEHCRAPLGTMTPPAPASVAGAWVPAA